MLDLGPDALLGRRARRCRGRPGPGLRSRPIARDLGRGLRRGLVLRLGLGHGGGCGTVRPRRCVTPNPTPHHYDSPGAVRRPRRPPPLPVPALRLRPQAEAADGVGPAPLRLAPGRRALRHRGPGAEVEDPRQHRRLPRRRARPGAAGAHGQPLAGTQRQRGDPPPGGAAQRDRLRGHRPLEPGTGAGPGGVGRARGDALRPDPDGGALLARPGALSLSVVVGGRHLPGRPAVLLPYLRGASLGTFRQPLVPADRVLQDPPLHLLRLLLRGEQGDAVHPDGADRQPPLPRPAAARADHRGLGGRHGGHRAGGRHRLRRAALRALHRAAVGGDGPGGLPRPRARALRGGRLHRGALLRPGTPARLGVAEPVAHARPSQQQRLSAEPGLVQHGRRGCRRHRVGLRPLRRATSRS